jgi:predicted GTPase
MVELEEQITKVLDHLRGSEKVFVVIYNKYNQGQEVVSFQDLREEGFTKMEVFSAVEDGLDRGLISGSNEIYSSGQIMMTAKGEFFVEALLEKQDGINV